MNKLPENLASRLTNIFTKEEMILLSPTLSQEKRPVSCRVNTLKSTCKEIEEAFNKASLGFTKLDSPTNCYLLDKGINESELWKLKIYKEGKIYLQGISSQIPVHLFSQKEGTKKLRILDACAAPGGKTSQLVELYPNAEIIAFEPFKIRYEKMLHNFDKLGIKYSEGKTVPINEEQGEESEVEVEEVLLKCIHDEIRNIGKYIEEEQYFDIILVDAPCSSEGSINLHNTKFLEAWDISHIKKNYKRQKHIIDDVIPYLADGGELIYSTCTIAPEENEGVVHYAICNYPQMQLQNIELGDNKYILPILALKKFEKYIYKAEVSEKAIRVIPSESSEGFFISIFKKQST